MTVYEIHSTQIGAAELVLCPLKDKWKSHFLLFVLLGKDFAVLIFKRDAKFQILSQKNLY